MWHRFSTNAVRNSHALFLTNSYLRYRAPFVLLFRMERGVSIAANRVQPVPGSEDQVMGRRFIRWIEDELRGLREHHHHPNRELFYDHVVVAHLIAFFNPAMKSLRNIEDIFDVPAVRKRLGLPRVPKSTLADGQRLFDPKLLLRRTYFYGLQPTAPSRSRLCLRRTARKLAATRHSFCP